MFDTMTLTKAGGALCGSLLILLLGNWAAEGLYHTGPSGHGAEGERAQAYVIDTGADDAAGEQVAEAGPSFAEVYAAADAAAGERVFGKCKACHKIDGANGVGPHLDGVVGREIAGVEGFAYSNALIGLEGDWTPEHMEAFLANPKGYAPGTKMSFAGLPKVEERANVIAYLATIGG
ncbi:c-type cytochrome [Frigidibacter mobilis]|uniref:Cytochrome c552 n=1 Tax=Frigidibacter mobilis TaxID=1335048 RepID=A0A159Z8T4_9RHOB|nr:cytochrome c family protein [Frigidibacter mobilis]AMY71952.1 cytochrome c552 [Frigidibacter mobilis]